MIGNVGSEGEKGKPVHKKTKGVSKLRKVLSILAEDHDDFR
jgi:hypothetical protein